MKWSHTERSERDYRAAPAAVQKAFDKQSTMSRPAQMAPLAAVR
jgi:hypothetical protein